MTLSWALENTRCRGPEARAAAPAVPVRYDGAARRMTLAGLGMAAMSLVIGLGAERFLRVAQRAAVETLDRPGYVRTVYAANETLIPGKHP